MWCMDRLYALYKQKRRYRVQIRGNKAIQMEDLHFWPKAQYFNLYSMIMTADLI